MKGNIRTKYCPKSFRACLRKFGQNSFAPPKICLPLHLWSVPLEIWDLYENYLIGLEGIHIVV